MRLTFTYDPKNPTPSLEGAKLTTKTGRGDMTSLIARRDVLVFDGPVLAAPVELVGEPLKEKHPEDEFLELGRIHFAAQNIRSLKQEGLKLSEGDFFLFHCPTSKFISRSRIRCFR